MVCTEVRRSSADGAVGQLEPDDDEVVAAELLELGEQLGSSLEVDFHDFTGVELARGVDSHRRAVDDDVIDVVVAHRGEMDDDVEPPAGEQLGEGAGEVVERREHPLGDRFGTRIGDLGVGGVEQGDVVSRAGEVRRDGGAGPPAAAVGDRPHAVDRNLRAAGRDEHPYAAASWLATARRGSRPVDPAQEVGDDVVGFGEAARADLPAGE